MEISDEIVDGFGVAMNEASWRSVEIDVDAASAEIGLEVLTLPEGGPMPEDRLRYLRLHGVSRVVASLRNARWDDPEAPAVPFGPEDLDSVLEDFLHLPVYGWEYLNGGDERYQRSRTRLSFDVSCPGPGTNTLDLFQSSTVRVLDFRVWFETVSVHDRGRRAIPIDDFIADGVRWWDAMYTRDERTQSMGLFPAGP